MHRYDERTQRIADAVFAYTRDRLALDLNGIAVSSGSACSSS